MVPGAYATRAVVPAARAVPVPAGVDDETAAAVLLQGMTAQYLTHTTYAVQRGDTVLVHAAAGGTGSLVVQDAKGRYRERYPIVYGARLKIKDGQADHLVDDTRYLIMSGLAAAIIRPAEQWTTARQPSGFTSDYDPYANN